MSLAALLMASTLSQGGPVAQPPVLMPTLKSQIISKTEDTEPIYLPSTWHLDVDSRRYTNDSPPADDKSAREYFEKLAGGSIGNTSLPPPPPESMFDAPMSEADIGWGHWEGNREINPSELEKIAETGRKGTLTPENGASVYNFGKVDNITNIDPNVSYSKNPITNLREGDFIGVKTIDATIYYIAYFTPLILPNGHIIPDFTLRLYEVGRLIK